MTSANSPKPSWQDFDAETAIPDAERREEWAAYQAEELKKAPSERWRPAEGSKLARDLYGKHAGDLFFVIGCGPSIKRAENYLALPQPGVIRIAVNRAILKIPAEYCIFIDLDAYQAVKDHPNAKNAVLLGVDRFAKLYGPEVHVWERAFTLPDLRAGRIVHRSTTLIAALHMATWLGSTRTVTVGCENSMKKLGPWQVDDTLSQKVNRFTYARINKSLMTDTPFWLPRWCTLADASIDGQLPLPKTTINKELEMKRGCIVSNSN